jgi:CheY-like chemotaxis protein
MPPRACVLIVDDEPLIRLGAVTLFSDAGYDVLEAANAVGAIDILKHHPEIGLLFTDIDMPGAMDGVALAKFVEAKYPPIRIIIASGKSQGAVAGMPSRALFLAKPYRDDIVLASAAVPP